MLSAKRNWEFNSACKSVASERIIDSKYFQNANLYPEPELIIIAECNAMILTNPISG